MIVLKWICFILVCLDTVTYIISQGRKSDGVAHFIGLCLGIAARVYVLYGAASCWLFD
jgi:hypothetical protein